MAPPLRVPYYKQALLTAMVVATAACVEGAASAWLHDRTGCAVADGPAATYDAGLRRQICDDLSRLQYTDFAYPDAPRLLEPGQNYETVSIDAHGFRHAGQIETPKPDGTYRIFVLGGSTVFGSGVTDDHTLPAHLESMFDLAYKVEVINAGVNGATSFGEKYVALNRLPVFEPDLVVIYDGNNDARARLDNPGINHEAHVGTIAGVAWHDPPPQNPLQTAWHATKTRELAKEITREIQYRAGVLEQRPVDSTPLDIKAAVWRERMESICDYGAQAGYRTAVFLQPIAQTDAHSMAAHYRNNALVGEALGAYAAQLERLGSCAMAHDLRGSLEGRAVFTDHVHLNGPGNQIIAGHIHAHIAEVMPAPPQPPPPEPAVRPENYT